MVFGGCREASGGVGIGIWRMIPDGVNSDPAGWREERKVLPRYAVPVGWHMNTPQFE